MDFRQLRYFLMVAEEKHFGRAAERLHIVQSALSMQIKALEDELGGALFKRTSRRVELTEAGERFQIEAKRVLAQMEQAEYLTKRVMKGELGSVRIAVVGNMMLSQRFIDDLHRFHQHYPDVEIIIKEMPTREQLVALENNEIDVCYAPMYHTAPPKEWVSHCLEEWKIVAVLPENSPLASVKKLTLKALCQEPIIAYGNIVQIIASQTDTPIRVSQRVTASSLSILGMVAAELGVTVLPERLSQLGFANVVFREIEDFNVMIQLQRIHRPDENNQAVLAFLG